MECIAYVIGGAGLGVLLNHFLVARSLVKEIGKMRREGFVLQEKTPSARPPSFPDFREPE